MPSGNSEYFMVTQLEKLKGKYAIFFDVDGTLATDDGVSKGHMEAIRKVQALGHKAFASTGRALSILQHEVRYDMNLDGIITGNGAYIVCDGKLLMDRTIDEDVLAAVYERYKDTGILCVLEGPERCAYFNNPGSDININSLDELRGKYKGIRISKITFGYPLGDEDREFLEQYFSLYVHPGYSEIAIKGCGKAAGMEFVARHYGIDRNHCIACGDSANDVEMLEAAGISVAMGNALDEVKEIADYVTDSVENDGLARIFEQFFGI